MKLDNRHLIAAIGIIFVVLIGDIVSRNVLLPQPKPYVHVPITQALYPPSRDLPDVKPNTMPSGYAPFGPDLTFGKSILKVQNFSEKDAVVKVMMLIDGKPMLARNFYVPKGIEHSSEKFPAGRFILRTAYGLDWNDPTKSFKIMATFSESVPFDLREDATRFQTMTITLHTVPHGNFHTAPIDGDTFGK